MSEASDFLKRTVRCGQLRLDDAGKEVVVNGWVHRRRDHGGLIFIDLRDRSGLLQVVFDPEVGNEAWQKAHDVRGEWVLAVRGKVRERPEDTANPNLATGQVELVASTLEILSEAKTPPFSLTDNEEVDDLVRMRYRYLDLRSARMQHNLQVRHEAAQAARRFLTAAGFWEIETPVLFRPTPEGARDYLVPSRVSPGHFYALPQSPQLMKQLLMVSGVEKYFQLARCYRDEDLRADRQPEHTQIDMEMSFVEREDIYAITEKLFAYIFDQAVGIELKTPFPRMTYEEAIARYGTDKPDTRFGMEFVDLTDVVRDVEFRVFSGTVKRGGQVKGLCARCCGDYSRAQLDKLTEFAQQHKAQGLAWMRVQDDGVDSPIEKFFSAEEINAIVEAFDASPGDLLLMVTDEPDIVAESLDWIRREMADREDLILS
ncbi:MAG: aspartate--tRNA ligase, partial [Armatimonadota bacterium]